MVIDGTSPPDTKRTRSAREGHDRVQRPAGVFSSSFLHEDKADIQRQILFAIRFIPEPFIKPDIVHALVAGKELKPIRFRKRLLQAFHERSTNALALVMRMNDKSANQARTRTKQPLTEPTIPSSRMALRNILVSNSASISKRVCVRGGMVQSWYRVASL